MSESLREEIKNDIARRYVEDVNQEMNLLADHIFSKIEKRIELRISKLDEMIKVVDESQKDAIYTTTGQHVTKIEFLDSLRNKKIGMKEIKELLS